MSAVWRPARVRRRTGSGAWPLAWAAAALGCVFLASFLVGRYPVAPHMVLGILASKLLPVTSLWSPFWPAEADMVVRGTGLAGRGAVSMEDVVRWNPEVVLVGRQYPLETILGDPRWRDIAAVRDGRVVPTPEGVFYWDGGPESILLVPFIAALLYPDRFPDFNMAAEVRAYYARFYRVRLSDDEVAKLLRGQSPDGGRHNPMNN